MKPRLDKEIKVSWSIFIGAIVLALLAGYVVWDQGQAAEQRALAEAEYQRRKGPQRMADRVNLSTDAIFDLQDQINELKARTGIRSVPPFLPPEREDAGGEYILFLIKTLKDEFRVKGQDQVDITEGLGFTRFNQAPPRGREEVRYWLTMVQLVSKAVFLCLSAPTLDGSIAVEDIAISGVELDRRIKTGPADRPLLLEEYPFTIKVTADLDVISWLLVQLSSDERTEGNKDEEFLGFLRLILANMERGGLQPVSGEMSPVGPLILRAFSIDSANKEQDDTISTVTVTMDLAGMRYLSNEERGLRAFEERRRSAEERANFKVDRRARP